MVTRDVHRSSCQTVDVSCPRPLRFCHIAYYVYDFCSPLCPRFGSFCPCMRCGAYFFLFGLRSCNVFCAFCFCCFSDKYGHHVSAHDGWSDNMKVICYSTDLCIGPMSAGGLINLGSLQFDDNDCCKSPYLPSGHDMTITFRSTHVFPTIVTRSTCLPWTRVSGCLCFLPCLQVHDSLPPRISHYALSWV